MFIVSGSDTIATLLSCTLYNLALNQDKQQLLFEEVKQTYYQVINLKYNFKFNII